MKKALLAESLAPALLLGGLVSAQLGFDPWTGTDATPARGAALEIRCSRGTEYCLQRAEALCNGPFRVVGSPYKSPRVQALLGWRLVPVNTDNPFAIRVLCG